MNPNATSLAAEVEENSFYTKILNERKFVDSYL